MSEIIAVPYKDGKVLLKIPEIKDLQNIDVEKVTRIQYDKFMAELLTFPVILNRLGLILAEAETAANKADLTVKIERGKLGKEAVSSLIEDGEKPTEMNVNNWVHSHARYRQVNEALIEANRKKSIVNSIYWSAKDKSDILKKLSEKIQPDEMVLDELLTEINGIKITVKENLIK